MPAGISPSRSDSRSNVTWWRVVDGGVEVSVRAVPGAKKSSIAETGKDHVRIRLAAPAVEGKANDELVRFVAEWFGVRASAVTLASGEKARVKRVRVAGAQAPPDTTMF